MRCFLTKTVRRLILNNAADKCITFTNVHNGMMVEWTTYYAATRFLDDLHYS